MSESLFCPQVQLLQCPWISHFLCAEWPTLAHHRPSHLELGFKPISVEKTPCLPQLYIWLLLYAMPFSQHFDSYYFWYACELMIHCHLMPFSSSSWSHGSSRAEIALFHIVAYAELCVEILNKYWPLSLDPKTSPLWNSLWWPFLNPFLGNLFPWNIRMLTNMCVGLVEGYRSFLGIILTNFLLSLKLLSLKSYEF